MHIATRFTKKGRNREVALIYESNNIFACELIYVIERCLFSTLNCVYFNPLNLKRVFSKKFQTCLGLTKTN